MTGPQRVIVAGVSTRAMAESAGRAGYAVTAVDGFGDLDLRAAAVEVIVPAPGSTRFGLAAAAAAIERLPSAPFCYAAGFEHRPDLVARLARSRPVWGNGPDALRAVRNPVRLARALAEAGASVPAVRRSPPPPGGRWLLKPLRSGGGSGIQPWTGGTVPAGAYVQERIAGVPASVAFVADGHDAAVLGLTRQLAGDRAMGADGFRYAGSLLCREGDAPWDDPRTVAEAVAMVRAATRAFGLMGVNGMDVIIRRGTPWPIELNPRWCASLELVERARGTPVFALHAAACTGGRLPAWAAPPASRPAWGKAVVYAMRPGQAPDLRAAARRGLVADLPAPGERLVERQPVCTVLAAAATPARCLALLRSRARRVRRLVAGSLATQRP